ncbi:hypothetical protein M8J76_000351 [Diaphorina citri]|nr:hypothetical protein M8J75_003689 [Diaphorina citri]KAI5732448.1 hypothetical protein M8J76_000351 [Diaphorina citri]
MRYKRYRRSINPLDSLSQSELAEGEGGGGRDTAEEDGRGRDPAEEGGGGRDTAARTDSAKDLNSDCMADRDFYKADKREESAEGWGGGEVNGSKGGEGILSGRGAVEAISLLPEFSKPE